MGDTNQTEQDKWMLHPSMQLDASKFGAAPAAKGGFDPLDMTPLKNAAARQGLYGDQVKEYLRSHHYSTDKSGLIIDGKSADYGPIIKALRPQLNKALSDDDMTSLIDGAVVEMREESGKQLKPVPPLAAKETGKSTAPVLQLAWNFIPVTGHVDTQTGKTSKDGPQHQASVGFTIQLHPDGKAGIEASGVANFTFDAKTNRLLNGGAGGQIAWVEPFFDGKLQVQAMVTALVGTAISGQASNGSVSLVSASMVQVGAGVQVMYAVPGFGNHLQVGFQLVPSLTQQGGAPTTIDFGPAGIVQVQW